MVLVIQTKSKDSVSTFVASSSEQSLHEDQQYSLGTLKKLVHSDQKKPVLQFSSESQVGSKLKYEKTSATVRQRTAPKIVV